MFAFAARAAEDDEPQPQPDSADVAIDATITRPPDGVVEVLPEVPVPFKQGESLKFSVQYGVIHAGTAWLEVPEEKKVKGKETLLLLARAESNKFFSVFYKVRNRIESTWDREGQSSLKYTENRREGGHKARSEINFDYSVHQAHYDNGATYPIPPQVQDALSSFYFTRYQALPVGGSIVFDYHASRKTKPLEVKVLGREQVKTPAGTFDCIALEPILKAGGIFKKTGRLVIWITDDERRMPVLMKSKVSIGSISVILQEARPGA